MTFSPSYFLLYKCVEFQTTSLYRQRATELDKTSLTAFEAIKRSQQRPTSIVSISRYVKVVISHYIFLIGSLPFSVVGVFFNSGKFIYLASRQLRGRASSSEEIDELQKVISFTVRETIIFGMAFCNFFTTGTLSTLGWTSLFLKHFFKSAFHTKHTVQMYLDLSLSQKITLLRKHLGFEDLQFSDKQSKKINSLIVGLLTKFAVNPKLDLPEKILCKSASSATLLSGFQTTKVGWFEYLDKMDIDQFDVKTQKVFLRWKLLAMLKQYDNDYRLIVESESTQDIFYKFSTSFLKHNYTIELSPTMLPEKI